MFCDQKLINESINISLMFGIAQAVTLSCCDIRWFRTHLKYSMLFRLIREAQGVYS